MTDDYETSYTQRLKDVQPYKRQGLKSPKKKGDAYERELAAYLTRELQIPCYRTPLSGGGCGFARSSAGPSADITGTPDLWIEAKRTERYNPRDAMAQALKGCNKHFSADMPVVINRPSHTETGDSLVSLRLKDFLKLYDAYLTALGVKRLPCSAASTLPDPPLTDDSPADKV